MIRKNEILILAPPAFGGFKRVSTLLLVVQWIVSLCGVFGGVGLIIYLAFKEDWKLGVAGLLFLPFLLYYVPTRWGKCRNPTIVFAHRRRRAHEKLRLGMGWAWTSSRDPIVGELDGHCL